MEKPSRSAMQKTSCLGIVVKMPDGKSPHTAYPFGLHDEIGDPWDYSVVNGTLILRARTCTKAIGDGMKCKSCEGLTRNETLRGILDRIEVGVHENSKLVYQGIGGLVKIIRRKTNRIQALRLGKLNDARKLVGKATALDNHKEWIMAVGSGKVERVDRLVRAGLARNMGIRGMLDLHNRASQRVYRTQNYTEEDSLRGLLLWRLGGARVAGIVHRSLNLPSLSTLRRRTILPPLVASPAQPTISDVEKNVSACFDSMVEVVNKHAVVHQVLMLDELKVEERPRWDNRSNMILGICREHGHRTSLEFTSRDEADLLIQAIQEGNVHLAVEVCIEIFAYCANTVLTMSFRRFY